MRRREFIRLPAARPRRGRSLRGLSRPSCWRNFSTTFPPSQTMLPTLGACAG